jgi:hypothetical protein
MLESCNVVVKDTMIVILLILKMKVQKIGVIIF